MQGFVLIVFAKDTDPYSVEIPKGEEFRAVLQTTLDSDRIRKDEEVSAVIQDDWYYNNILIAPRGSVINGKIVKSRKSGNYLKNGNISLQFHEIVTPTGILQITTNVVKVTKGKFRGLKLTGKFIAGALIGAMRTVDLFEFMILPVMAVAGLISGIMNISEYGSEAVLPAGTSLGLRTRKKVLIHKPLPPQSLYVPVLIN